MPRVRIDLLEASDPAEQRAALARNLAEPPGVRGEQVLVNRAEGAMEDGSFGLGAAHCAPPEG